MPRAHDDVLVDAMRASARLVEAAREILRWEWDARFSAVLGAVKAPHDAPLLEVVTSLFPTAWDQRNIAGAPLPVKVQAADWGGLMAGQRLFTLDPEDDPLFFAAWWPWGSGTTFSLRLGCSARSPEAQGLELPVQLRRWFSV